jgi:hypothetical protein
MDAGSYHQNEVTKRGKLNLQFSPLFDLALLSLSLRLSELVVQFLKTLLCRPSLAPDSRP